ncbi:unnamed protein product [Calypogeia fissa]
MLQDDGHQPGAKIQPQQHKYDDYEKVLKPMYEKIDRNPRLNAIGMPGLLKLRDELFSLHARQECIQGEQGPLVDVGLIAKLFIAILGADRSLKPKESFLDRFMKRGCPWPIAKKKSKEALPTPPTTTTTPFA